MGIYEKLRGRLYGETNIKNLMAGRADKKPAGSVSLFFEHGVKAVLVAAHRTYPELCFYFHSDDFFRHGVFSFHVSMTAASAVSLTKGRCPGHGRNDLTIFGSDNIVYGDLKIKNRILPNPYG